MKNIALIASLSICCFSSTALAQDTKAEAAADAEAVAESALADAEANVEVMTDATPRPPRPQIRAAVPPPPPPASASEDYDQTRGPRFDDYIEARFVQVDYPPASVVAEENGRVEVMLYVDANGALTDCQITEPSEYERLNQATCPHIERRATFKPAIDADGEPVAGEMRDSVYWRVRKPEFEEFSVHFTFTQSATGEPLDCKLISLSGTPPMGMDTENPCKGFTSGSRLFRDENGVPVSKRVEIKIGASVTDVVEGQD